MTILKLRMLRINHGYTIEGLAKASNVSAYTLKEIEEKGHVPRPATAKKIADVYGMQATELFPELMEEHAA